MVDQLELEIERMTGQYSALGREFRHLIVDELKEQRAERKGAYAHLKNPGTKSKNTVPFENMKFRFSMIPRLPNKTGNGVRNLSVGRDEILLCVYTLFEDTHDYKKGLDFVEGYSKFRFVFGVNCAYEYFCNEVFNQFMERETEAVGHLTRGEYKPFVSMVMPIVNENLGVFKAVARDLDYHEVDIQ